MDSLTGFHMLEADVLFRSHPNKLRRTERIQSIFVLVLVFSDETFNQERDGYPIVFGFLSISKVEISPNFNVKDFGKFFLLSFMKPGYIYRENWCFLIPRSSGILRLS